jgi:hypothetical protein
MRHFARHEPGSQDSTNPPRCNHVWRFRAVPIALADCTCEACDWCGTVRLRGMGEDAGPGAASYPAPGSPVSLESLARRWSPQESESA